MRNFRYPAVAAAMLALGILPAPAAEAATFVTQAHGQSVDMVMSGEIQTGDALAFSREIGNIQSSGHKLVTLGLNSPGGKVVEAVVIADLVQKMGLTTYVPDKRLCASSCFMVFAAGQRKVIGHDVYVGVHSAGDEEEGTTPDSRRVTLGMANYVRTLGVPDALANKMSETPYESAYWLNDNDLRSMGVVLR